MLKITFKYKGQLSVDDWKFIKIEISLCEYVVLQCFSTSSSRIVITFFFCTSVNLQSSFSIIFYSEQSCQDHKRTPCFVFFYAKSIKTVYSKIHIYTWVYIYFFGVISRTNECNNFILFIPNDNLQLLFQ